MKIYNVFSELNLWIDFLVFIPIESERETALAAIKKAVECQNDDGFFECYGDALEYYLNKSGVTFRILDGFLNDDETNTSEEWNKFVGDLDKLGLIELVRI